MCNEAYFIELLDGQYHLRRAMYYEPQGEVVWRGWDWFEGVTELEKIKPRQQEQARLL